MSPLWDVAPPSEVAIRRQPKGPWLLSELRDRISADELSRKDARHRIEWHAPWHGETRSIQQGQCLRCNVLVDICTSPLGAGMPIYWTADPYTGGTRPRCNP